MIPLDTIVQGDCLEVMRGWPDGCVDAIVTDPPYELGFMGKAWDSTGVAYRVELWAEALRVLKPGGHLLAFGGTRTYHRMACAIEDAGFEIRDMIDWLYGSGFPKSHPIGKAIDKAAGVVREVVGKHPDPRHKYPNTDIRGGNYMAGKLAQRESGIITAPATPAAKQWDGWGTALKPGHEPICVARKPFPGTVADNVLEHGTGGLNIDAGRIEGTKPQVTQGINSNPTSFRVATERRVSGDPTEGRWPANVVLDPDAAAELDEQSGELTTGGSPEYTGTRVGPVDQFGRTSGQETWHDRSGGASRFFYCAKASRSERNAGAWELYWRKDADRPSGVARCTAEEWRELGREEKRIFKETGVRVSLRARGNIHSTVKPVSLMRWLVRLVTPPGGVVLDPFAGSGTTCVAAKMEGVQFIGIELDPDYCDIARARVGQTEKNLFAGT